MSLKPARATKLLDKLESDEAQAQAELAAIKNAKKRAVKEDVPEED